MVHPPPLTSKLGDDLLVEILIRGLLNPRFACRSKLVCRKWSSLISSPCFNRRFVSHCQSRSAGEPPLTPPPSVSSFLPVPDETRQFLRVLDSFKDLVLCGFAGFDVETNGELGRSYLICNPLTKQWITLPLAPEKSATECATLFARLVCEPCISQNLDLGDGQPAFVYSEYRFRVVCMYKLGFSTKLDMFCSESGKWAKEALVLHGYSILPQPKAKSCDGKLFWAQCSVIDQDGNGIVEFNPFCLDVPPTFIYDEALFRRPASSRGFSVSHGGLHMIQLETEATPGCSRNALTVWRLEDDRRTWTIQYEVLLETIWSNYVSQHIELGRHIELGLHPEKPETALLTFGDDHGPILSCDLRSGELQYFSTQSTHVPGWMLFQPRVSCWPTQIPSYEELRGIYDGRYSCWVQQSINEAATPSVVGDCFC